jgi:hypothetical protein
MRLTLTCVIFLASLPLSAQSTKLSASAEKVITFDCAKEQTLISPSIPNAKKIRFILNNKNRDAIKLFWIRRDGGRDPYTHNQPIGVGESYPQAPQLPQSTYEGDIWVVTDTQDRCLAIFAAGKSDTTIDFPMTRENLDPNPNIDPNPNTTQMAYAL